MSITSRNYVKGLTLLLVVVLAGHSSADWPQFRGRQGSGIGTGHPPVEWDVKNGKNIQWERTIGGAGHSCPIVVGDRVFVTTAVRAKPQVGKIPTGFLRGSGESVDENDKWYWQVVCYQLTSGIELWRRTVASGLPKIKRHLKATHANSSPASDGKRVVAFFGSEGLYCLDLDGNLLWKKDFGRLHSGPYNDPSLEWGFASSPVIHDGKVIVQCDCLNVKFLVVLDLKTGRELRRIPRKDVASWSTPLVLIDKGVTQVVCNGYHEMAGYDLDTGKQLWKLGGGGDVPVPTPLFAHHLIYLTNAHGRNPIYAISPQATGDLSIGESDEADGPGAKLPDGVAWHLPRGGSYIPTPIVVGDELYVCSDRGILTVFAARTGKRLYTERLGGIYSASAVASSRMLYFASEDGKVRIVPTGPQFVTKQVMDVGEPIFATPAIAGDRLLIRTTSRLICVGKKSYPIAK